MISWTQAASDPLVYSRKLTMDDPLLLQTVTWSKHQAMRYSQKQINPI